MLSELIFGALGDAALEYASSKGLKFLNTREARQELAAIGASAIEAGIPFAPSLAEDLRSESFVKSVFVPVLRAVVIDPSQLPDPEGLAGQYIEMFVARYSEKTDLDETLKRVFFTDTKQINSAFVETLKKLRSLLYASKHWRELGHLVVSEATFRNTEEIKSLLSFLDRNSATDTIDIEAAKIDAKTGSDELRSWPRTISGREIYRPELDRLKTRISAASHGATILIGEAGSGKSALLSNLTEDLERTGWIVFGIKADTLPADVVTFEDVSSALGMKGSFEAELNALARQAQVVLIIDQLDAVSDVMDRTSRRMQVLLRLVRFIRERSLPVHVVVASRPFEAAHDARFQQLHAEEFKLSLPSVEIVQGFLSDLGIDATGISPTLLETLRRPFALKLYVDLVDRHVPASSVDSGNLLDRWLATADLGTDTQRQEVLRMMDRLASEMLSTETLWRPLTVYETNFKQALTRAEACGLVVRSGAKIGFSHQSWLDDFQARAFTSGHDLAEYAWLNQDSLFVRATVLRALERLRIADGQAYQRAVYALLWSEKTRRHLKHLVVDVLATSPNPSAQEGAWIEALVTDDVILANRALGKVADQWPRWRLMLRKCFPVLMTKEPFHWRATQLLAAEIVADSDYVVSLLKQYWNDPQNDRLVFRVVESSGQITAAVESLVSQILTRTQIESYSVSHFVRSLRAEGRYKEACRIAAIWFTTQKTDRNTNPSLYEIDKLAEKAPHDFVEAFLEHYVKCASTELDEFRPGVNRFPKSLSLPRDWGFEGDQDKVLGAFASAMSQLAAVDHAAALPYMVKLTEVHIDEVQEVAARAFVAGGTAVAEQAYAFLMADERRFQIGDAHVELEPGLSSIESGLTTQELIEALAAHLSDEQILKLSDQIEGWSLYSPELTQRDEPEVRLRRLRWADEHKIKLLERLPQRLLAPRRRRQVSEWRGSQRHPAPRRRGSSMATFVGSPMSHESMAKARDEDIFAFLDEIHDRATERSRRRPISMDGGVIELSRAFGEFGKQYPERAIAIAKAKFVKGRHEHAAGQLVDELSKEESFAAERLLEFIHELSARGFASRTWKTHASWALARLANKLSGLPDRTIALLETWLENEPAAIATKTAERITLEVENERRNKRDRAVPNAIIFGSHHLGGMRMVPQHNYSVLDTIFHGLIGRNERAYDDWLTILEHHAEQSEDPHVWSFLLLSQGRHLYWADRGRVRTLLSKLWGNDQRIFLDVDLGGMIWSNRGMIPSEVIIAVLESWILTDEENFRQAAAELAQAFALIEPLSPVTAALSKILLEDPSPELNGRLFTVASVWREKDVILRNEAHKLILTFVEGAEGDQAHAISSAVDKGDTLAADELTRELLLKVARNEAVLGASLTSRFADGLQSLLLYPNFDETVMEVTERIVEMIITKNGGEHRGFIDKEFVQVTIALQRNDGPLRSKAMDVYEKLLDAGAYGAEEAAKDVLSR